MNEHQSNFRRFAAKAFEQSLEQLHHLLGSEEAEAEETEVSAEPESETLSPEFEEDVWEDAVADIEQYLQQNEDLEDDA
ncbi:hypothetical protein [Lusitaniella coriacea]|uniref:hypothetical protein n=1 Tax=Lusitaniella coriacea TaxID=1983105 RepID=UPI003CE69FA5